MAELKIIGLDSACPTQLADIVTNYVFDEFKQPYMTVLNLADVKSNSNKSFILQLLHRNNEVFFIYTRAGRVGNEGTINIDAFFDKNQAIDNFKKIARNKTGIDWNQRYDSDPVIGKYQYVLIKADDIDIKLTESHIPEIPGKIQNLVKTIFDVDLYNQFAKQHSIDTKKLPVGALRKSQIIKARETLIKMKELIDQPDLVDQLTDLCSQYYTLIPTNLHKLKLIDTVDEISNKLNILKDLEFMSYLSENQNRGIYEKYKSLNCTLSHVTDKDTLQLINKYIKLNKGVTHNFNLKLKDVYEIYKQSNHTNYRRWEQLHNRKLLWHGTPTSNIVGILTSDFQINPSKTTRITGRMFGDGIYFSDTTTKSAGYSNNYGTMYMFICEVALGTTYNTQNSDSSLNKAISGTHSTLGVGCWQPDASEHVILDNGSILPIGKLISNNSGSSLNYNEYIVYNTDQIKMKYLVEIEVN